MGANIEDFDLFQTCHLEEIENDPKDAFEYKPCQRTYKLRPEDEISLDSIFSDLLAKIEPTEEQFKSCLWDVTAKDMLNKKQALLFEEKLYITVLQGNPCVLREENKIIQESELDDVGYLKLKVEESYEGYVVFSSSQMTKGKNKAHSGYCLKGRYDDKFVLIKEKRCEFNYEDTARIEKTLKVYNKNDTLSIMREALVNGESYVFRTEVNTERDSVFVLDGGIQLLMRYLILKKYIGEFEYHTLNIFGKVLRGVLTFYKMCSKLRIFYRDFQNLICVKNTQYRDDVPQESSETYFLSNGKIVLHYWLNFKYVIHAVRRPEKPKEKILPKLELMWKSDKLILKKYERKKKLNYENAVAYLKDHPEVVDLLYDYVLGAIQYKPDCIISFACKFFQNLKHMYD